MSLLNIGFLSEAINEKGISDTGAIFDYVRERLVKSISKDGQQDGFDGILICIDKITRKITYAAAHNNPILIKNGTILELEHDKMPVGKGERSESFRQFEAEYQSGDILYLYTDGYADQFGGPKGKKFKYKQLHEALLDNRHLAMEEQKHKMNEIIENWKGHFEQVDDILLIGIKL
jgi:serine phosphatase RsbU (regulator of sigma subunit)